MLKEIMLILIPIGCAGTGRVMANAKKRRAELLGEILAAVRVLRIRMLNSMEPLSVLLRKSDSSLFCDLGNSLWVGSSLSECWAEQKRTGTKRGGMLDSLGESELHVLDELFENLGGSGRDEQAELFGRVISQLEEMQDAARKKQTESAKMYTALGALAGVMIAILMV